MIRRHSRWIDITAALGPRTRVYPGDPPVEITVVADPDRGDAARVSALRMGAHAGTHVDAPVHLAGGRGGVETLSLDAMIGPALVVRTGRRSPGASEIARLSRPAPRRILFRGAPIIRPDAAAELIRLGCLLVGTDGLSIDPEDDAGLPAHHLLLRAGVVILEGLDLSRVRPGRYHLIALPLLIPGADGAPARAVLRPRGR
jgi:arylformamidase